MNVQNQIIAPVSKTGRLRAAVFGAGYFGRIHAGKYAAMADVDLVAVVDSEPKRAEAVAAEFGAAAFAAPEDVIGRVDISTIATPANTHYDLTRRMLAAGIHVLVEKPIALNLEQADHMIRLARANRLVLQVGHQERYVLRQFGLLDRTVAPSRIECRRAGPFSGRGLDVSVVMDLMIHDLDLVHQVAPAPVAGVRARTRTVHGDEADETTADLWLADGTEAHLFASRIAKERERSMKLVYPDGEVFIDFVRRTLTNTTGATIVAAFGGDGETEAANDPVGHGVRAFTACVRERADPWISGPCGRRALETALRVSAAAGDLSYDMALSASARTA